MPTLMIVGAGRLGSAVLEILAFRFPSWRFVVVSRNASSAVESINLRRYILAQWNEFPSIHHESVDVLDREAFRQTVDAYQPDIVFNATTPFPWWQIDDLPGDFGKLAHAAGPGMWAALDLLLPLAIVEGLDNSRFDGVLVNGCYPDMTNVFLRAHRHAPVVGIGNISNLVPGLRLAYGREWGVSPTEVNVRIVGHHFTSLNGPSLTGGESVPYYLEVRTTNRHHVVSGPNPEPFELVRRHASRTRGTAGQGVTANSAATVLSAFMTNETAHLHCPGAIGLPGGYPVIVSGGRVSLDLPLQLTAEEAIHINELAQMSDGVEWVGPGEVRVTQQAQEAQQAILGKSYETILSISVDEIANHTLEVLRRQYGMGYEERGIQSKVAK